MDRSKRFGRSIIGFNKNDVYEYIEELYKNFDNQLKEKDQEINNLNKKNLTFREQIDKLNDNFEGIEDYKTNIADVLLNARSQGQKIIKDAHEESEKRKIEVEEYIIKEKEKLNIFREELILYKNSGVELLRKFEVEIDFLIESTLKE